MPKIRNVKTYHYTINTQVDTRDIKASHTRKKKKKIELEDFISIIKIWYTKPLILMSLTSLEIYHNTTKYYYITCDLTARILSYHCKIILDKHK